MPNETAPLLSVVPNTSVDPKPSALSVTVKDHRYHPLQQTLAPCTLELAKGEVVSIIGPSGCGKSTFLRIAAGLIEASEGKISNASKRAAILFQEHRLLPWKSLLNNISFGLQGQKLTKFQRMKKAREVAYAMGFSEDDLIKYPSELSGGMRQRGALARAWQLNLICCFWMNHSVRSILVAVVTFIGRCCTRWIRSSALF
ncbi:ATP-binding cassette domain-containing protein [Pseudovibrio denitrificans]|uniref:ATP-binding cassette domain-containing protein n=1 Tax=Pseudovibrio denitrificans TaxID=258256 RepID=UPI000B32F062|nr:ATP-binding cassette domain-containing protein [Pseudovibrio denitrificans]